MKFHVKEWLNELVELENTETRVFIVGREQGLGFKHENAIMAIRTMSNETAIFGSGRRWSNTSYNVML